MDLRDFDPVEPLAELPATLRQTALAKMSTCPRSFYLYHRYKGGPLSHPLIRGSIMHSAFERVIRHLMDVGEPYAPPEIGKDILAEVVRESELTVPPGEHDSMRAMMFNFCNGLVIDPEKVLCVETPVRLEVGGWTLTGIIDFAQIDGNTIKLYDWKTAFMSDDLPDNAEWQGSFQTVLYSMALAFGTMEGAPFPLQGVENFEVRLVHPRIFWEQEQTMGYRMALLTRDVLQDRMVELEALVAQVDRAFQTWDFPAVPGDHCSFCPASAECPIPGRLRDWQGEIRTVDDAQRAAILIDKDKARASKLQRALKGWAALPGNAPFVAGGYEYGWESVEKTSLRSKVTLPEGGTISGKQALALAAERAAEYGVPFNLEEHYRPQISMTLKKRKLSEHELGEREETDG
jgi:hypothetical protein